MPTNDQVLTTFLNVLTVPAGGGHHNIANDVNTLMNQVFCVDNGAAGKHALPCVAITEHGHLQGPGFFGVADVTRLFTQLFTSFPDVALTPISGLRLYSPQGYAPNTIAVQADLIGSYQVKWFPKIHPPSVPGHYSPPLSDLNPAPNPPYKKASIPAAAVFEFDNNNRVTQLAIYMDRYRFVPNLSLLSMNVVNREIAEVLEKVTSVKR
jgi:hypothetical protein